MIDRNDQDDLLLAAGDLQPKGKSMKKTIIIAACVLGLSTAIASAQSSQGNVGPGTNNNMTNNNNKLDNGTTAMDAAGRGNSTTTTGSGMSGSGMTRSDGINNGIAANPSSQGNAGPGTTPSGMSK